jgi:hypothetical protein
VSNPFATVFADTADFESVFSESVTVEMVSIPREEWEWLNKYAKFQERMYLDLKERYNELINGYQFSNKGDK